MITNNSKRRSRAAKPILGVTGVVLVVAMSGIASGQVYVADDLRENYYAGYGDAYLDPLGPSLGYLSTTPLASRLYSDCGEGPLSFSSEDDTWHVRSDGAIPRGYPDYFGAVWFGTLTVGPGLLLEEGDVTFGTRSDDGSVIWIDGELVVNNLEFRMPWPWTRTGTIDLQVGSHDIYIGWFNGGGFGEMEARFCQGGDLSYEELEPIDPCDPNQAGLWSAPASNPPLPAAELLARWRLDETSGNAAYDSAGHHDGVVHGDPTWMGGSLLFDGEDDRVTCGTFNPSEGTGQITVALWAKWHGANGEFQGLIAKRDTWNADDMMWQLEAYRDTGALGFFREGSYPYNGSQQSSSVLPVGVWTHVAAMYDGVTTRLYIDGAEEDSGWLSLGSDTSANITVGACEPDGSYPFNGELKDVRIYDRALSSSEIRDLAGPTGPWMIDIGLRVYDGTSVVTIACEEGAAASPLRIAKNGTVYGIVLVDPSDANASGIRIETSSGVKALRKM